VVRESSPREGKDGLVSMTTEAVVNVKALQKSLNQMSRDERIELIRAGGDPKVAVRIVVRDADAPGAPAQASPVAENLLKERIKSFGFRTWSDDGGTSGQVANFAVLGEAQVKKLSLKLEASGVVVTKYTLASWTVKCIDRDTGEELYYNTTLPKGVGSWASEGEALKAIGTRIADEFTRDFFLQHLNVTGRKVTLDVEGLPSSTAADELGRELTGLPAVISAHARPAKDSRTFDLLMVGSGAEGDLVASGILKPLNAKLGQACFGLGAVVGDAVTVVFDRKCADAAIVSRFETHPPAGLYGAPPGRQKAVIRDPELLKRLTI
jgi:serine/threonine-protein kinase